MRALLDINVLLALLDASHQFHARARDWLKGSIQDGWASSPITQNGLIRILSQPGYPNRVAPAQAISRLAEAAQSPFHAFWNDDLSILDEDAIVRTHIHGPKQLTDLYLLALAVHHEGRFVSFDENIAMAAVRKATSRNLLIL